jgi:lactate dehydrogenase-like 2-hydroxyacid dehydrogenase
MKVVAYSVKPFEKEFLAKANQKQHDITLISNQLSLETVSYAEGKEGVIVFTNDDVSERVINQLAILGIKYIITRSTRTDHIDRLAAKKHHIKIANVPFTPEQTHLNREVLQEIANQTIRNLDLMQAGKCLGSACVCNLGCRVKVK